MTSSEILIYSLICHSLLRQESPTKKMDKQYYVYILANEYNTTLYIGVTNNLIKRIHEHKNNLAEGFTEKYNVHRLVFYEVTENIDSAITREKRIKSWKREWKNNLIKEFNPTWKDLYNDILPGGFLPSQE